MSRPSDELIINTLVEAAAAYDEHYAAPPTRMADSWRDLAARLEAKPDPLAELTSHDLTAIKRACRRCWSERLPGGGFAEDDDIDAEVGRELIGILHRAAAQRAQETQSPDGAERLKPCRC